MMRTVIIILVLILWGVSCKEKIKQYANQSAKQEDIFSLHDTLEIKYDALPVYFDTLYVLARQVITLADNYINKDTLILAEIYRDCAEVFRLHCDCEGEQALSCCTDTSLIIDSYKKAIDVHYFNHDTLSSNFSHTLFQLADVYEQLEQSVAALPLRQQYLGITEKTKGIASEITSDAYMFLGQTYERLKNYQLANEMYQRELKISEELNSADLIMEKERIESFRKKYNIQ